MIAMDVNETRLNFCREKLQVSYTINATASDVMQQLQEITGKDMPTVVIDATGNLKAINNALQYLAHGGRYVLVGLQKEAFSFSHPEFHKRETTLMSSRNATRAGNIVAGGWPENPVSRGTKPPDRPPTDGRRQSRGNPAEPGQLRP